VPRFGPHPDRRPAVVTGASSGIGAATAIALAGVGHPVVLGARRLDRCEAVAAGIRNRGGEAHALWLDLTDTASVEKFANQAEEVAGPIEVAVACAGQSLPDSAPDAFETMVDVNMIGTHRLVTAMLPAMKARGRGDLVFVSSEVVRHPRPGTAAYVASKWGMEGYARTLQMQLEGTGVRASIVQAGQAATEMGSDWEPDATAGILESWIHWGLARHDNFLVPDAIAAAVVTVVATPPGTHLTMVEVSPEAPIRRRPADADSLADAGPPAKPDPSSQGAP
jgi:NADP-dependent 3-hydroxy acid dehydrogenase YdfG